MVHVARRLLDGQVRHESVHAGLGQEFRKDGIAANALWPRTVIATAAIKMLGGDGMLKKARSPEIMADAAHAILTQPSREFTRRFCIDEVVLAKRVGVVDFSRYVAVPGTAEADLLPDFFVPEDISALG